MGDGQRLLLPAAKLRHRLVVAVGSQQQKAGDAVAVELLKGQTGVVALHQLHRAGPHIVDGDGLDVGADLPSYDQLLPTVAGEILIVNGVDGGAAALDDGGQLIAVLTGVEHVNFQGLFTVAEAEKGQRLVPSVAVDVHHLEGLDVPPGGGSHVFVALRQQLIQLAGEGGVFRGQAGQGEQLLHGTVHPASGQQQAGQQQQPQQGRAFQMSHRSPPYQTTIILLYHSTVPVKRVVFFVLSGENFKKAVDNRRRGCYILGYKKGIDEEAVRRRSQRGSPRGARDLTGSGTVPPPSRPPNGNQ